MNVKDTIDSLKFAVNELDRINLKTHGDLHGCDCEGGCNCKPELWYDLETLKYHFLGTIVGLEENETGSKPSLKDDE